MESTPFLERLKIAFEAFDLDASVSAAKECIEEGINPKKIISQAVTPALETIGQMYEEGEIFLSELILAGTIGEKLMEQLKEEMDADTSLSSKGKVIIGTVEGDYHDIGKNIVISMLLGAGFDVKDLGIDVSYDEFIRQIEDSHPDIVCLSCLLTTTIQSTKKIIQRIEESGLRKNVKIIVGGRAMDSSKAEALGADYYGDDGVDAVSIVKRAMKS